MSIPNLPGVSVTVRDGAFASTAGLGTDRCAIVGTCTGGTANTVYEFTDLQTLVSTLGTSVSGGPAVEAAALILAVSGKPVVVVPTTNGTAGSVGTVTRTGTGPDPGAAFTGTPLDAYNLRIKITLGGTVGTARFRIAFDGDNPDGPTYSDEYVTAASVTTWVASTGLTVTFAAGTYVVNDVYSAACVAPTYTNTNLNTALTALLADSRTWRFVFVVGEPSTVSTGATMASTLDTALTTAQNAYRYAWGLIQAPSDTDANIQGAYSSFSSRRVAVAAGFETVTSVISGRTFSRGAAWATAARAMAMTISQDLGEVRAGPLSAVTALTRDERKTPGLDASGFLTHRSIVGLNGAFVCNPRIMAPAGSDFLLIQYRQVMDVACTVGYSALLQYVNAELVTNEDGTLDEVEAQGIDAAVTAALAQSLTQPNYATAVSATADRTNNVLSTQTLKVKIRVQPKGYAKAIEAEIGFLNPNLVVTLRRIKDGAQDIHLPVEEDGRVLVEDTGKKGTFPVLDLNLPYAPTRHRLRVRTAHSRSEGHEAFEHLPGSG